MNLKDLMKIKDGRELGMQKHLFLSFKRDSCFPFSILVCQIDTS